MIQGFQSNSDYVENISPLSMHAGKKEDNRSAIEPPWKVDPKLPDASYYLRKHNWI